MWQLNDLPGISKWILNAHTSIACSVCQTGMSNIQSSAHSHTHMHMHTNAHTHRHAHVIVILNVCRRTHWPASGRDPQRIYSASAPSSERREHCNVHTHNYTSTHTHTHTHTYIHAHTVHTDCFC